MVRKIKLLALLLSVGMLLVACNGETEEESSLTRADSWFGQDGDSEEGYSQEESSDDFYEDPYEYSYDESYEESDDLYGEGEGESPSGEEAYLYKNYSYEYIEDLREYRAEDTYKEEDLQGREVVDVNGIKVIDPVTAQDFPNTNLSNSQVERVNKEYPLYLENANPDYYDKYFVELINQAENLMKKGALDEFIQKWVEEDGVYAVVSQGSAMYPNSNEYRIFLDDGQIITVETSSFDTYLLAQAIPANQDEYPFRHVSIENGQYMVFKNFVAISDSVSLYEWGSSTTADAKYYGEEGRAASVEEGKDFLYNWAQEDANQKMQELNNLETHTFTIENVEESVDENGQLIFSFESPDIKSYDVEGFVSHGIEFDVTLLYQLDDNQWIETRAVAEDLGSSIGFSRLDTSQVEDYGAERSEVETYLDLNNLGMQFIDVLSYLHHPNQMGTDFQDQILSDFENHPEKFMWRINFDGDDNMDRIRLGRVLGGSDEGVYFFDEDYRYFMQHSISLAEDTLRPMLGIGMEAMQIPQTEKDQELKDQGSPWYSPLSITIPREDLQ